jgi:hypothetical protein
MKHYDFNIYMFLDTTYLLCETIKLTVIRIKMSQRKEPLPARGKEVTGEVDTIPPCQYINGRYFIVVEELASWQLDGSTLFILDVAATSSYA